MSLSDLVVLKLAEERYAQASCEAFAKAEEAAYRTDTYPVVYPEPYASIGSGYDPLSDHVRAQCNAVAAELELEADFCDNAELLVTLHCGTPARYAEFVRVLGERLESVVEWVDNAAQLWPQAASTAARARPSV